MRQMRKCLKNNFLTLQVTEGVSLHTTNDNTAIQVRQHLRQYSQQT